MQYLQLDSSSVVSLFGVSAENLIKNTYLALRTGMSIDGQ